VRSAGLIAIALVACGPPPLALDPGDEFIAFADDFNNYTGWQMFHLYNQPQEGNVHTAGDRFIYLNRTPPKDSTTFPVGTVIVKQLPNAGQVFAMVKRGGDFNEGGALNWEWFQLQDLTPSTVMVLWRGVGPPLSNESYGADPTACNMCHAGAVSNDYVQADVLKLSGL